MTPGAWIVLGILLLIIAAAALLNAVSIATGSTVAGEPPLSSGQSGLALFLGDLIGGALLVIGGVICIQRGRHRLRETSGRKPTE